MTLRLLVGQLLSPLKRCLRSSVVLFASLFTLQASYAFETVTNCVSHLTTPKQVITEALQILKADTWHAQAHACIAMAYYKMSNPEMALKRLKIAEEQLPHEVLKEIHDTIWHHMPELVALKEFKDGYAFVGGDCLLKNVTALNGSGKLVIGKFYNPTENLTVRHIRAFKQGKEIDFVCPECKLISKELELTVNNYQISELTPPTAVASLRRNITYINTILRLQSGF